MDAGGIDVAFCPEVLGPLGRLVGPRFEPSPGLAVRIGARGLYVRGAAVADGWWRHGCIEPWAQDQGWLYLGFSWQMEEGLS